MRYPSFARARRFGRRATALPVWVFISGIASALALACLLVLVLFLFELITLRDAAERLPNNTWLSSMSLRLSSSWTTLRDLQDSVPVAFAIAAVLSFTAAGLLYWFECAVQAASIGVGSALRKQIHAQAHRLGAYDLFAGSKSTSIDLLAEKTECVRVAQAAWWRVTAHGGIFILLMLVLAFSIDFRLAIATLLLTAACWWVVVVLRAQARRRAALAGDRASRYCGLMLEDLGQNQLLGNLTNESHVQSAVFEEHMRHYNAELFARDTAAGLVSPLIALVVFLGLSLVLLLAGYNVLQNPPRLSLPDVVLLVSALGALAYPAVRCERLLEQLPSADKAADDIFTYLDRPAVVGQLPQAAPLEPLGREIKLESISLFSASGTRLLDDVTVSFPQGSQTVLFSSDEATPVALSGLLARFLDPSRGRILFDGRDLKSATLDSVRHQVALVLPENLLFNGTLAENLVGEDSHISSDQIIEALKLVHAYDFIQPLPEALETLIGPHGLTLSAGQALRLGLARSANAPIGRGD